MNVNTPVSGPKTLERGASQRPQVQMKRTRANSHRVPKWAYLLFIILAAFFCYRAIQRRASESKATQQPIRPMLVVKVISEDVRLYIDEIGIFALYETFHVQAQV